MPPPKSQGSPGVTRVPGLTPRRAHSRPPSATATALCARGALAFFARRLGRAASALTLARTWQDALGSAPACGDRGRRRRAHRRDGRGRVAGEHPSAPSSATATALCARGALAFFARRLGRATSARGSLTERRSRGTQLRLSGRAGGTHRRRRLLTSTSAAVEPSASTYAGCGRPASSYAGSRGSGPFWVG